MKPRIFFLAARAVAERANNKTAPAKTDTVASALEHTRQWFKDNGVSISEWCRTNKLDRHIVVDLLNNRLKGRRGKAHAAAIALGLKADPKLKRAA